VLVSRTGDYDTQPSLAIDARGDPWTVWVDHAAGTDRIVCTRASGGSWSEPAPVTARAGSYVRPVLAFAGDQALCAWTETGEGAAVWSAHSADGVAWSAPECVTPAGRHLNPELAADGHGGVWAAWTGLGEASYDVFLARFDGNAWGAPTVVCDEPGNDWDPAVACTSAGDPVVVWSAWRDDDYDLYVRRRRGGALTSPLRIGGTIAYDLHPTIAVDARDRPWIAWDRVAIPAHGGSGKIEHRDGRAVHAGPDNRTTATVELRCLDGDRVLAPAVPAPELKQGHMIQHCAYPRVACAPDGSACVVFRAWDFRYDEPHVYWWDVMVYRYAGDRWERPELLPSSDGGLEELSTATEDGALWIAAEMEHRVTPLAGALHPEAGSTSFEFDHHWALTPQGEDGDVYITRYPFDDAQAAELTEVDALTPLPADARRPPRTSRAEARYEIEYDGRTYQLLFGDTHKHSNVSRCSAGRDPSVGDHYRYSHDACRYDFLVISDHSGHTSDHNWWRLQQFADLFDARGFFAALYGYEISNGFPTGHKNVIFESRPSRILRIGLDGARDGPTIWKGLEGERAITIGHTSAGMAGTDWSEYDPRFERLVEVFQPLYGSSEYLGAPRTADVPGTGINEAGFVSEALKKGLKLGMIASTDHGLGAAYAVVYAEGISRKEVFEALWARRCYGSTIYGAVLDFRVNGRLMGEEIEGDGPAELAVRLRAPLPVVQLDVFENARLVKTFEAPRPQASGWTELAWTAPGVPAGTTSYYVRATLEGDELVWSSPVWVTPR